MEDNSAKLIILASMIGLTVFSNFCSIVAIASRKRKISRMYYFLLNLSVADLLTAFLTLMPELISAIMGESFYLGEIGCKLVKFLQMVVPYLSSYILVVMSMDRYQTICHPLVYHTWKPCNSHKKIGLAYAVSLAFCLPQLFVFGGNPSPSGEIQCSLQLGEPEGWKTKVYVSWFCISSFFLPLVVLIYCYAKICVELRQNLKDKDRQSRHVLICQVNHFSPEGKQKKWNSAVSLVNSCSSLASIDHRPRSHSIEGICRAKIRSIKQTVVIILSYVICSAVAIGFQIWSVWITPESNISSSIEWFFWLVTWNSILNPWIYIILNRDLQISLRNFFCPCNQVIVPERRISHDHPFNHLSGGTASTGASFPLSNHHHHHYRQRSFTVDLDPKLTASLANHHSNFRRSLSVVKE